MTRDEDNYVSVKEAAKPISPARAHRLLCAAKQTSIFAFIPENVIEKISYVVKKVAAQGGVINARGGI